MVGFASRRRRDVVWWNFERHRRTRIDGQTSSVPAQEKVSGNDVSSGQGFITTYRISFELINSLAARCSLLAAGARSKKKEA